MERSWLEKFYTECGREVSLAYTVLNQANNWGVTVALGFLTTIAISVIKLEGSGAISFNYPTFHYWYLIILGWILLVRFFVRSVLGLANMYRWNILIHAASRVLSVPDTHPAAPVYIRNCSRLIDAYYYQFRSPVKQRTLLWRSLKLMYFWIFAIFLSLFVWGIVALPHDLYYLLGIWTFAFSLLLEYIWFRRWHGLQYKLVELEQQPEVSDIWEALTSGPTEEGGPVLILGFCQDGPYKRASEILGRRDIMWIPWSYHVASVSTEVANEIDQSRSIQSARVAFASWPIGYTGVARVIRYGTIDHITMSGGSVRLTVNLDSPVPAHERHEVEVNNPKVLCFQSSINVSKRA